MGGVTLYVEEVQPSTAVQNAIGGCFARPSVERHASVGTSEPQQLLVSCGDYLQLWEPVDGSLEVHQTFQLFERVEHMDLVPSSLHLFGPDSTDAVLLFTYDGRCALFTLTPQSRQARLPAGSSMPSSPGRYLLVEVACLTLPLPHMRDGLMPKRLQGVCSSGVAPVSRRLSATSGARGVVVVAAHMGLLHVLTLHASAASSGEGSAASAGGGSSSSCGQPLLVCVAVQISDTPIYGLPQGSDPLYVMQHMTHVQSMCFMPPADRDAYEQPLLAVLHKPEGTSGVSLQLDSLAVRLSMTSPRGRGSEQGKVAGAAAGGSDPSPPLDKHAAAAAGGGGGGGCDVQLSASLLTGPWSARSLHPTTTLLTPFPGVPSAGLPAGILTVSSRSATLYARPPSLGAIAVAAAAAGAARKAAEAEAAAAGPSVSSGPPPPAAAAGGSAAGVDPYGDGVIAAAFDTWFGKDFLEDSAIDLAEATVRQIELVQYGMAGLPACVTALAPGVIAVGDSSAGLHLIHAAGSKPWYARIQPSLPGLVPYGAPSVANVLCHLRGGGSGAAGGTAGRVSEPDGLLFLGSCSSNSQVLSVPAADTSPSAPPPFSAAPPSAALLHWPLAEVAAIKSLAPVTDVTVVPDSSGADDPWVVASCGSGATGRLIRARLAAGLQPYMAEGPQVPDGCRMFALRLGGSETSTSDPPGRRGPPPGGCWHTHIAFSFEAASRTDLLSVASQGEGAGGGDFCQVELPGLDHLAPSLLVADVGALRLVQVLQGGIRVLEPLSSGGGLAAEWLSPEPLSLAAHSGSLLAAASRSRLQLLRVDLRSGTITQLSQIQPTSQLSALALCRCSLLAPPPHPPTTSAAAPAASGSEAPHEEADATLVLMGQWISNRVEVAAVADLGRPLLQLQLGEDETPRSLALMELPGGLPPVLMAATNTGQLAMWQLAAPLTGRGGCWDVGPGYSLRISQAAGELQPVTSTAAALVSEPGRPAGGGGVYLHSSSGAMVRPTPTAAAAAGSRWPPLEDLVEVVRVHGSDSLQALCHVSTAAMPGSACWVTREGQLLFGRLDPRVRLRWSTAFVGETIHSLAYHPASHCLLALCESLPGGDNCLRVIHADTLQQVMSMRLAPGHYHTAITVAPLPCTSGDKRGDGKGDGDGGGGGGGACSAEKEFVVLASYLMIDSSADPRVREHVRGGQLLQGALSFLEVVAAAAEDGSNATRYSMLLHGTCTIPAVAHSLGVARPLPYNPTAAAAAATAAAAGGSSSGSAATKVAAWLRPGGGRGGGEAAAGRPAAGRAAAAAASPPPPLESEPSPPPHLIAGCQDGVYLFAVHVDDGDLDGGRAVSRAVQLVGQLDELELPLPVDTMAREIAEAARKAGGQAAAAALSSGGGAEAMSTDGDVDTEGLAEDESELPEVAAGWQGAERDEAAAGEAAADVAWSHGLGAVREDADSDEEDFFAAGPGGRGARREAVGAAPGRGEGRAAPEAARAARALRKRMQGGAAADARSRAPNGTGGHAANSGGGSDSDSEDSSAGGSGGGGGGGRGGGHGISGCSAPLRRLLRDVRRDWNCCVTLRQLARAQTYGGGCVVSLSCLGHLVAAGDFLGSVTLLQLLANRRGVALLATSLDRHPIFAQASMLLAPSRLLVAVHPHGLALLRRDECAEDQAMQAAQRQAVADYEAGVTPYRLQADNTAEAVWEAPMRRDGRPAGGFGGGGGGGDRLALDHLELLKMRIEQLPDLDMVAACRIRHMATRMCRAPLGLRLRPCNPSLEPLPVPVADSPSAARGGAASPAGTCQEGGRVQEQVGQQEGSFVLCFSVSGHVAAVRLEEGPMAAAVAPLAQLQAAVDCLGAADMALLTGVDSESYCHDYSWPLVLPRETAVAAGLAGVCSSSVAGGGGAAGGSGGGGGGVEHETGAEEEAQGLAAGCVDGSVLRLVLAVAEAHLEAEAAGGGGGGGGEGRVRVGALLRRLAEAAAGSGDVRALAGLLQIGLSTAK